MRILLFLLCGSLTTLFAQNRFQLDRSISSQTQSFSARSQDGQTVLLFLEGSGGDLYVLDQNLQLARQVHLIDLPIAQNGQPLGLMFDGSVAQLYYLDPLTTSYQSIQIDTRSRTTRLQRLDLRDGRSHLHAGAFTYEGVLHIMRLPRTKQSIRLCRFTEDGSFSNQEYLISRADFLDKADRKFVQIHSDSLQTPADTWHPAKLYQHGDMMYLSLDESDGTYVVGIDLKAEKKWERSFPSAQTGRDSSLKVASLIHQQELMQLSVQASGLAVQVRQLNRPNLIASHVFNRESHFQFKHQDSKRYQTQPLISMPEFIDAVLSTHMPALAIEELDPHMLRLQVAAVKSANNRGVSGIVLSNSLGWSQFDLPLSYPDYGFDLPLSYLNLPRLNRRKNYRQLFSYEEKGHTWLAFYDPRQQKITYLRR
ncbi:MAG: hypothetical protein AAF206_20055 [Bacteroidota bacterium]